MRLEREGIPAALVAVEKLARTTGRGMARVQGMPDLPIAIIEHTSGIVTEAGADLDAVIEGAARQVAAILLTGRSDGAA